MTPQKGRPARRGERGGLARSPLDFDVGNEERRISEFIRTRVRGAGAGGVVVGLSGGIDSSVVAALCAHALGKGKVLGLMMPSHSTPEEDMADARRLAERIGIATAEVRIANAVDQLNASYALHAPRLAAANVQARVRMTILYLYANAMKRLVAGTGDRSELEIGFFTKYGDGGVDLLPIAHLYKTQVRALGAKLGLSSRIVAKPSSPQLWPGHRATDEIPVDYGQLDLVLYHLLDKKTPRREIGRLTGVPESVVKKVLEMHRSSAHKRSQPPRLHPPREG